MDLLRFYVDLRPFSLEERLILSHKLENYAFICHAFPDVIGLFEVFWDYPSSISQVLEIPDFLVTTVLNKNGF